MRLVTLADVRDAAERIAGKVVRTPLLPYRWAPAARPLWLKPENLQAVGAFKVRGAAHVVARMTQAQRSGGVVAYSSGNHAQAVEIGRASCRERV